MLKHVSLIRILFYLTIIILAVSCSKKFQFKKVQELENYRDVIERITKGKLGLKGTNLYFVDDLKNDNDFETTLATCYSYEVKFIGDNYIEFSKTAWQRLNNIQRLVLMSHELLHCDCNMDHKDDILEDGCPASVMHTFAPRLECIEKHLVRYFDEIKLGCKE